MLGFIIGLFIGGAIVIFTLGLFLAPGNDTYILPVGKAYRILVDVQHKKQDATVEDYSIAVEEAIGYLGEALV